MKAGYRAVERALAAPAPAPPRALEPAARSTRSTGRRCVGRRDPVPVGARAAGALRRPARADHGRRRLDRRPAGDAAARLPARARDAAGLPRGVADRRPARAQRRRSSRPCEHVLGDIRDGGRLAEAVARARPDVIFHLAAYKHVDWAETHPEEFVDTNLQGSWNVLRAAEASGVGHRRRRLDRQGGAGRELLRAHEALHGAADRLLGARGRRRTAAPCGSSTCSPAPAAPPSCSCARRAPACR